MLAWSRPQSRQLRALRTIDVFAASLGVEMDTFILSHALLAVAVLAILGAAVGAVVFLVFKVIQEISPEGKLERLSAMRGEGLISEAEFVEAKGKVLSRV
jgi:ABC-type enterobactin transport system permease subunit